MSERLIDVWSSYEAPEAVIREFRTIDPRAELVYVQRGKWWLGLIQRDTPVMHDGLLELARLHVTGGAHLSAINQNPALWARLRLAQLKAQGFRRVILPRERWTREPMWRFMIEWFRKADFCFRHIPDSDQGWEDAFKPHERAMMNTDKVEEAKKRLVEYVHQEKSSLMRRMQRNALVGQGQYDYRRAINQ